MKKLTFAIALFAFVGSASVNAAVNHTGDKIEKTEKKTKKMKACSAESGAKACCKKKAEAKAETETKKAE